MSAHEIAGRRWALTDSSGPGEQGGLTLDDVGAGSPMSFDRNRTRKSIAYGVAMTRVLWATAEAARARRTASDCMTNKRKKRGQEKGYG